MPELPEVETLRKQLDKALSGKAIAQVEVLRQKSFQSDPQEIEGARITGVQRRAKILLFSLTQDTKTRWMLIHLKMTGQLIYQENTQLPKQSYHQDLTQPDDAAYNHSDTHINNQSSVIDSRIVGGHPTLDWIKQLPSNHTRVIIRFTDRSILYFNDMRVFGWMKVLSNDTQVEEEFSNYSPVEPLQDAFTPAWLHKQLQRSSRAIKQVILDQSVIAGIGNIYANDALWRAQIDPQTQAKHVNQTQAKKLHEAINYVINLGIKYGGATESTYRQLDGLGGSYQEHMLTYKRQGKPCLRCNTKIVKIKVGGRGTYFCPGCQS